MREACKQKELYADEISAKKKTAREGKETHRGLPTEWEGCSVDQHKPPDQSRGLRLRQDRPSHTGGQEHGECVSRREGAILNDG